ncbi:MAG: hypothetical protein H6622_13540 [Halobacteriovoraceae bacterium]|nr:hypothetical protein [Halobacteriovoraceae bacterium]
MKFAYILLIIFFLSPCDSLIAQSSYFKNTYSNPLYDFFSVKKDKKDVKKNSSNNENLSTKETTSIISSGQIAEIVDGYVNPKYHCEYLTNKERDIMLTAKEEYEKGLPKESVYKVSENDFSVKNLSSDPPANCGYKSGNSEKGQGFKRNETNKVCQAMNDVITGVQTKCHLSNCTTASFLAIIKILKQRSDFEKKYLHLLECKKPFPRFYLDYGQANLIKFTADYELGKTARIEIPYKDSPKSISDTIKNQFAKGIPQSTDALKLDRNETVFYAGHAAIFSHFKTDDGKIYNGNQKGIITEVCYWSSNYNTNGSGARCEKLTRIGSMQFARINGQ